MGDDDGSEPFWEEAIGQTPDEARYYGRHYQHEVELGQVDKAVHEGRHYEASVRIPAG